MLYKVTLCKRIHEVPTQPIAIVRNICTSIYVIASLMQWCVSKSQSGPWCTRLHFFCTQKCTIFSHACTNLHSLACLLPICTTGHQDIERLHLASLKREQPGHKTDEFSWSIISVTFYWMKWSSVFVLFLVFWWMIFRTEFCNDFPDSGYSKSGLFVLHSYRKTHTLSLSLYSSGSRENR